MIRLSRRQAFSWAAVVLWMLLIFALSAQPADQSNGLSQPIAHTIAETENKQAGESATYWNLVDRLNKVVRKSAHFSAYLVLGVLSANALRISGVNRAVLLRAALLICVLYATSDELHQLFVPGRTALIQDVLIDSAGAVIGLGLYRLKARKWSKC